MVININGVPITIREDRDVELREVDAVGQYRPQLQEIWLMSNIAPESKKRTLIHELAHAFINEHLAVKNESFTEENVCDFIAMYSMQINEIANEYFVR